LLSLGKIGLPSSRLSRSNRDPMDSQPSHNFPMDDILFLRPKVIMRFLYRKLLLKRGIQGLKPRVGLVESSEWRL